MLGQKQSDPIYQFGDFSFDPEKLELKKLGPDVDLKFQPARLLKVLVENSPEIVMRKTLQDENWDNGTTVEFEAGLNACVNQLRSVLGDSARSPQYIATFPKRGYRFVAPVEREKKAPAFRRKLWFLPILFVAFLLAFALSISTPISDGHLPNHTKVVSEQILGP